MAVTRAGGYANLATNASNYIPEIYAARLVQKFYAATVFGSIANTNYEGEIKNHGDTVHIRTTPNITIRDYEIGGTLTHETLSSDGVDLLIDKAKYFSFGVDDVDKMQSDLPQIDKWAEESAEQMKIAMDVDMLGAVYADVAAANAGTAAGAKSANINLGDATTPVALTKSNILDYIVDCGTVLDEQNIPGTGRWLVLPPKACGLIKKSDLKDASLAGDGTSILRNGRMGIIDRFEIYNSNNINLAGGEYDLLFGHPAGLTFATQMVKNRRVVDPQKFQELIQGLCVYGYEVINDTALGHGVVTI